MTTVSNIPADAAARERALALDGSFIVRAPAGSGKTDLLTRRFLKLLAIVEEPEEILAITFTRAATAEMRARTLKGLEQASHPQRLEPSDDEERLSLARAALAQSERRGWRLLEQPHRLNIETIDSLCLRIAHNQPLLSRLGGKLSPTENGEPLYAEAARRTMGRLGSAHPDLNAALAHLLELRDNNLPDCERLIAEMLARRDQWIRAFPLTSVMNEEEWAQARSQLERPFRGEVGRVHGEVYRLMMSQPLFATELISLAQYAYSNGNDKVALLAGVSTLPRPEAAMTEHWRGIADFLLTDDQWRRPAGFNARVGFPLSGKEEKDRMKFLLTALPRIHGLREALCAARDLPEPRYEDKQWETLRHIFMTLRQAIAELRVLFAERDTVDFIELGISAREVLSNPEAGPDVLLALSGNIRHFLVDEFQDTSRSQHELLRLLVRAWEAGDGRTCFLVGDPMQSVYLFRQAEVELFEHVTKNGLVSEEHTVTFEPLELSTNFRSHEGLTTRWNEIFSEIFEPSPPAGVAHIRYSHTFAANPMLPNEAVHVYPQIIGDAGRVITPEEQDRALEHEAQQVLKIIEQHQDRIDRAIADGSEFRVAVLVRSRTDLARIVGLLRERGVPFRAVELEKLNEQQELIDLLSLARTLLHPMDRVAWLSVLRAPWCGLTLDDLHKLTGADDPAFQYTPLLELIDTRLPLLSPEGAARLEGVAEILKQALAMRFQGLHASSFSQWIERTWRSLGGPQCIGAAAYENTQVSFAMLDAVTPDGMVCLTEDFEAEMGRLYAQPDPSVSERAGVQLMTIHKAKGLGFDVVIVPGLDRRAAQDNPPLISSLERANPATGDSEMLVVPIGYRGDEKHPTYRWVQKQISHRQDEELKRLLYVACTRARRSLHLLGTATITALGLKAGDSKSLLSTAWPALQDEFERSMQEGEGEPSRVIGFPERSGAQVVFEIAAGADSGAGSGSHPKLWLRRLPLDAQLKPRMANVHFSATDIPASENLARPEGSRDARHKGSVVHALLERLSRGSSSDSLRTAARSMLRNLAYSGKALEDALAEVLTAVRNCLGDPDGAWILASHPQAQSEASWTGWRNDTLETLRADRVFVAGPAPRQSGEDCLWIIDYKMSAPAGDELFLECQREIYAPQLIRYAKTLREAQNMTLPVRLGLYYPRIPRLDWWAPEES